MRALVSIYIIRYYQNGIYCSQVKLTLNPSDTLTFYPEPLRGSNDLYSALQTDYCSEDSWGLEWWQHYEVYNQYTRNVN